MSDSEESWLTISVTHRKEKYDFTFHEDAIITDLFDEIEASLDIPVANQKLIAPKLPLLKSPPKDPQMSLRQLNGKTLTLMGSSAADIQAVQTMAERVANRNAARMAAHRTLKARTRNTTTHNNRRRSQEDSQYTFLQVRPLQGLPHPEKSQALLMRLKEDPGIRAAMKKHKFTVSLLTEMEPLAHTQTTHEGTSRILGLNRNQGETIELRLRTDAHDGYRDYKTIRKTLCHELAHNVHGPHDRNFWDLCHQIEREVQAADWKSGGQTIGETSYYQREAQENQEEEEDDDYQDHGGWTGGEFVLGGGSGSGSARDPTDGMSRREILAQAALQRQRNQAEAERRVLESDKWKKE
ncbi:WLM domain-containing protein [Mariannaea sp. PMI_226]|nr:WLM domain-containing protein [Mariannaea sp. PMI_226]